MVASVTGNQHGSAPRELIGVNPAMLDTAMVAATMVGVAAPLERFYKPNLMQHTLRRCKPSGLSSPTVL